MDPSFAEVYRHVRFGQPRLVTLAASAASPSWRQHGLPVLTGPEWIPAKPLPLDDVRLEWRPVPPPGHPARQARPVSGYSAALSGLVGMGHLFDGRIYRPLSIDPSPGALCLTFTSAGYFDHLDETEVLAYEAAAADLAGRPPTGGRYRAALADPFDLAARTTCFGLVVLTVRVDGADSGFYLHRRDGGRVVAAPEMLHCVPAGNFAPAGKTFHGTDFDLWHVIAREYLEEFLDADEVQEAPDYEAGPLGGLAAAYGTGALRLHVLGVGLDPLTWTPELFVVGAVDAAAFDALFSGIVAAGREGTILVGPDGRGIPFTEEWVRHYASEPVTRSGAQACLTLAWGHRAALGLTTR
jgi:hypothetical protein